MPRRQDGEKRTFPPARPMCTRTHIPPSFVLASVRPRLWKARPGQSIAKRSVDSGTNIRRGWAGENKIIATILREKSRW